MTGRGSQVRNPQSSDLHTFLSALAFVLALALALALALVLALAVDAGTPNRRETLVVREISAAGTLFDRMVAFWHRGLIERHSNLFQTAWPTSALLVAGRKGGHCDEVVGSWLLVLSSKW